MKVSQIWITK